MTERFSTPDAVEFHIECEQPKDYAAIREVTLKAFATHQTVADLVDLIRGSPQHIPELSLVVKRDREAVGHVMLSHADLVDEVGRHHQVVTLSPVSVLPSYQGRGIGSRLIRFALGRAEDMNEPLVILEGSPDCYPRFGFELASNYGVSIDLPEWAPPEAAMVYPLSRYSPSIRGKLVYPPAFRVIEESPPASRDRTRRPQMN